MKRKLLMGACSVALAMGLSACQSGTTSQASSEDDGKISIVTTSFHEYDWVSNIIEGNEDAFSVILLMDTGVDLHSYEPNVEDISTISSADLFIHNGGTSETWTEDILANPLNPNLVSINLMDSIQDQVVAEVTTEGMQADSHDHAHDEECTDENCDHDHADSAAGAEATATSSTGDAHDHSTDTTTSSSTEDAHDHSEETASAHDDEHIWLSLSNAAALCDVIENSISTLDPTNKDLYEQNLEAYTAELAQLDEKYAAAVDSAPRDTLLFTDRFPFVYLMQDYGINYYAAFQGCSAETEASFETIVFLSGILDEYDMDYVLILDNGLEDLANTVIETSEKGEAGILTLNSLQSVTADQIESGATYLSLMEDNLEVLKQALA